MIKSPLGLAFGMMILGQCSGCFILPPATTAPLVPAATATSTIAPGAPAQIKLEGENSLGTSGGGMDRGAASNRKTSWMTDGSVRNYSFVLPTAAQYMITVVASNDSSSAKLESLIVTVDGGMIGAFTVPDTGSGGNGWNVFASGSVGVTPVLSAGTHSLSVTCSGGDSYGTELDVVILDKQ